MRLGVSYNLFDGEELLEGSINQIRNEVDYISVVYQKVSNFGNKCDDNLIDLLNDLIKKNLIDELFEYKPIIQGDGHGHLNEITKRNIGLSLSLKNNCTHHMSMDSDEYYKPQQFKLLKKVMLENNYDSSFCQMKTYYKDKDVVITPPEDYYVSLIYKISDNDSFIMSRPSPVLVDPTRRMNPGKFKIFNRDEVQMHHLSYVRNNIRRKLENSSSINVFKNRIDLLVKYHENWTYPSEALMAGVTDKFYKTEKVKKLF
jgi:hypothetical protein